MSAPGAAPGLTGMADAVISEIAALLSTYAETGETAAIDLTAMPLTTQDRQALESRLGRGEVEATVDSAGRSEIWETAYAGVWFVRHFGAGERVATETIEIAAAPAVLMSHPDDCRAAAARLSRELNLVEPRDAASSDGG